MTIKGDGPTGWMLDKSVADNPAERLCARCEVDYSEIFSRLGAAIGLMEKRVDLDALLLLQRYMILGVNDITDFIKKDLAVAPDAKSMQ
jgi:hypothetical protein